MRSAADAAPSFVFLPELASAAHELTLAGDEAHYVTRVVRARAGERVTATDGVGTLATLVVQAIRPVLVLAVEARRTVPQPPGARLLVGAPEGERGDWLVEKLAELGVRELVPTGTGRARGGRAARHDRWERLTIAALRQSRSPWRMRVLPPVPLSEALAGLERGVRWLADPAGEPVHGRSLAVSDAVTGAVGP